MSVSKTWGGGGYQSLGRIQGLPHWYMKDWLGPWCKLERWLGATSVVLSQGGLYQGRQEASKGPSQNFISFFVCGGHSGVHLKDCSHHSRLMVHYRA